MSKARLTPFGCVAVWLLLLAVAWGILVGAGFALVHYLPMAYTWWRDESTDGQFITLPVLMVLALVSIIASIRKD